MPVNGGGYGLLSTTINKSMYQMCAPYSDNVPDNKYVKVYVFTVSWKHTYLKSFTIK